MIDNALVQLSAARTALGKCKTAMEAKQVSDVADAARIYLQRTQAGIEAVNEATEIRILSERAMGKFLAADKTIKCGRRSSNGSPGEPYNKTLSDLGISKKMSMRSQKMAGMPDAQFEYALDIAKKSAARLTIKAVVQHAVTNKTEPDDSTERKTVMDFAELSGTEFGCIYADPPWQYANQGTRASTNNHYGTMTVKDIEYLPVADIVAPKAHLHLWVTNAFLQDGFKIMEAWGFEFKSTFVWVKPQMGMGNYWRNSHEIMLTGTRGGQTAIGKAEMSWLECRRGAHSAKPDMVRDRIRNLSPGPYLEMFGRRSVEGWTVFGNEVVDEFV